MKPDQTTDDMPIYLTLGQAADALPRRRAGKKTSLTTLYRWSTAGCRGVLLRTIQIGATRCTTREWLDEFFANLTAARAGGLPGMTQSASARRKSEAKAARAALGLK